MQQALAQLANAPGTDAEDKLLYAKLQTILSGDRNPALATDPNLSYEFAVELQLLLEGLT